MEIIIGDNVKFINENLSGVIKSIVSVDKVVVSCSDGFDHEVFINEIVIVNENNMPNYKVDKDLISNKISSKKIRTESKGILSKYLSSNKYKYEGIVEIDLHLEELVEFPGRLDDRLKLHTQIQHVKKCLAAAMDKNIRKVVFIHGVGTGVLKTELHNFLANIDDLIINDADFREYGLGATEVIIK
jgi:dsDNA-specific endonuclease/ATPase MutS2